MNQTTTDRIAELITEIEGDIFEGDTHLIADRVDELARITGRTTDVVRAALADASGFVGIDTARVLDLLGPEAAA